jgi:DNA-binding NtrC family response regulator
MKLMMDYEWPGNVRELENVIERSVVLATGTQLDADLLPETLRGRDTLHGVRFQTSEFFTPAPGEAGAQPGGNNVRPSLFQMVEEVERRIVLDMLERTGWNQTEAAERFQIPLSTLNQKIKRLGIVVRRRGIGGAAAGDYGGGK